MNLELSQQDIQVLFEALGELPLKISGPTFTKIQEQILNTQHSQPSENQPSPNPGRPAG